MKKGTKKIQTNNKKSNKNTLLSAKQDSINKINSYKLMLTRMIANSTDERKYIRHTHCF